MNLKEQGILYFCRDFLVQYETDGSGGFTVIWEFPHQPFEDKVPIFMTLFIPVDRFLPNPTFLHFWLKFLKRGVKIENFTSVLPLWFKNFRSKLLNSAWDNTIVRALESHLNQSFEEYIGLWLYRMLKNLTGKPTPVVHLVSDYSNTLFEDEITVTIEPNPQKNFIYIELWFGNTRLFFEETFLFWFEMSGNPEKDVERIGQIYESVKNRVMSYPSENILISARPFFEQLVKKCWTLSYEEIKDSIGETIKVLTEDCKVSSFVPELNRNKRKTVNPILHLYSPMNSRHPHRRLGFSVIPSNDKDKIDPSSICNPDSKLFYFVFKTENSSFLLDDLKSLISGNPKETVLNFCAKVSLYPQVYNPIGSTRETLVKFYEFINGRYS